MATDEKTREEHLEVNFAEFKKVLPGIMAEHRNEYALMRNGKIEDFYFNLRDALSIGNKLYPDRKFSVQKVSTEKVDMGVFSHVGYLR